MHESIEVVYENGMLRPLANVRNAEAGGQDGQVELNQNGGAAKE